MVSLRQRYGLFIDGRFVEPASGKWFPTVNPATEDLLAEVAEAGEEDVDLAVTAARRVSKSWGRTPGAERAKYLYRIARMLQERAREFAVVETMDGGKPIRESRERRSPTRRRPFLLSRRVGGQARVRLPRAVARAARRGRSGDPVELPDDDARLEGGTRSRYREHSGSQAR